MKALAFPRYKAPLRQVDAVRPDGGEDDVVIAVAAAGLNHLDERIRLGEFRQIVPYSPPLILGHELAGTIVGVGSNVRDLKPGDKVFARPRDGRIGTFAEFVAVDRADVALKPASISMTDAASLPLAALTAWQALVERGSVLAGQKVLVHAGAGGVGALAIQLAVHLGATVTTTVSAANSRFARDLGAAEVIDYRNEDFAASLSGYDLVLDSVGGDTLARSLSVLAPGGKAIGIAGPPDPAFARAVGAGLPVRAAVAALSRGIRSRARKLGVTYEFLWMHADGGQLRQIASLIDAGAIRPVVGRVVSFADIPDALGALGSGGTRGRTVATITTE